MDLSCTNHTQYWFCCIVCSLTWRAPKKLDFYYCCMAELGLKAPGDSSALETHFLSLPCALLWPLQCSAGKGLPAPLQETRGKAEAAWQDLMPALCRKACKCQAPSSPLCSHSHGGATQHSSDRAKLSVVQQSWMPGTSRDDLQTFRVKFILMQAQPRMFKGRTLQPST